MLRLTSAALLLAAALARAEVFTVSTVADAGPGSLRQAILDANARPGADTIAFAIGSLGSPQSLQPASALPSITDEVTLDGWSQGGSTYAGAPLVEINGALSGSAGYALRITAGNTVVRGLALSGYPSGTGIILLTGGGHWIYGNHIGVNLAGDSAAGNGRGIHITGGSTNNLIGTNGDGINDATEWNLISGNSQWGVEMSEASATDNVVAGNRMGTDASGTRSLPNGFGGSPRAAIYLGGTGNRIGTDGNGVSDDLERNLISGNAGYGILLSSQADLSGKTNWIVGNLLGTDLTGQVALGNAGGIASGSGPNYNFVIRDNVIAGNAGGGITISGLSRSTILGNAIGVAADRVTPLGNGSAAWNGAVYGIYVGGNDNQIGGTGPGEGNLIAHHTNGPAHRASGIAVAGGGVRNSIRGNRIFNNQDLGIDLNDDRVPNPNDAGDADSGANGLQNSPVLTVAQAYADGTTVIQGTLDSSPDTSFVLDFYFSAEADPTGYGEGEHPLGEATVATDASGHAAFEVTLPVTLPPNQHVTATATSAEGNTSEFSLAYAGGGVLDVPLAGLSLEVTQPSYVAQLLTVHARVDAGTGVSYAWDFGDGHLGSGPTAAHAYPTAGAYTVTVTATNNSGSASTSTVVRVLEPANINGIRWVDRDADGFFGLGEIVNTAAQEAVVTATLLEPPHTVLTTPILNGSYQILTPQAGSYRVEVTQVFSCTYLANCVSTPNPTSVVIGGDGSVEVNFGILPVWFVPHTNDAGFVVGRVWIDTNGNGYPEVSEAPLNGRSVRLLDASGNPVATYAAGSNWGSGSYAFRITSAGTYRVQVEAPPGMFPASREVEVYVADRRVVSAQLPFLAGGTIGGQVTDGGGAGVAGVDLTLQPGDHQTLTDAGGHYQFPGLADGAYALRLNPPPHAVTPNGLTERLVSSTLNSSTVENWTLLKKGELTITAVQLVNGDPIPVGFVFFEVLRDGSVVRSVYTSSQGDAKVEGLEPGLYTVRPWDSFLNFLPGLAFLPAQRTAALTLDAAASVSFTGTLPRSLNLYAWLPGTGTPPTGFACFYEVRSSTGSVIDQGYLPADRPTTSNWNLNPATLEVRLIPDPTVPGQEGWPTHRQIVVLDDHTHANVYYPYNPANRQTLQGYAFQDHCLPEGIRANGSYCNETGVPGNNGLTVTLHNDSGAVLTNTQTTLGTGWNTGFYRFADLPAGNYQVSITLPSGYTPTTSTNGFRFLDGVAAPEQIHFGYQRTETPVLTGQVYVDADGNGSYDPSWDDPVSGSPIAIHTAAGALVASLNTASDGAYSVAGLVPGDYRLTLTQPDGEQSQTTTVPALSGLTRVDFPLPPPGSGPRVLVFADANHNGLADPGEQRFASVEVQLVAGPCEESGVLLQAVPTGADGVAVFALPPAGDAPLCGRITQGLPPNMVPLHLPGVAVPRGSGLPVPVPVVPSLQEPPLQLIGSLSSTPRTLSILFRAFPGRSYAMEQTGDLVAWEAVTNNPAQNLGYARQVVLPLGDGVGHSFFRITEQR